MRRFDRLHSYTTGESFHTWVDKDRNWMISKEVHEGYCLLSLRNDMAIPEVAAYFALHRSKRRNATLRECLETYNKLTSR